ncbi:hypothetical protein GQ457_10G013760 [Hibiscus cannabinus]
MENNMEATEIGKICKANVNWVNFLFKKTLNRNELGVEIRGTKNDGGVVGLDINNIRVEEEETNLAEGVCEEVKNLGPSRSKNELLNPKSIQSALGNLTKKARKAFALGKKIVGIQIEDNEEEAIRDLAHATYLECERLGVCGENQSNLKNFHCLEKIGWYINIWDESKFLVESILSNSNFILILVVTLLINLS